VISFLLITESINIKTVLAELHMREYFVFVQIFLLAKLVLIEVKTSPQLYLKRLPEIG